MFLTALLLGLAGVVLSALGTRAAFRRLSIDAREMLLWIGVAELPAVPVARRERLVR